jgi:beta-lactamase superfamily II metal-dependent hydrolase
LNACKIWVFDIGRGVCSVIRTPIGKWIMIDLGSSGEFNPIYDFLIPQIKNRNLSMHEDKYVISQLILSHPHDDHMTCIEDFNKRIYPSLLTTPNDIDHQNQPKNGKLNWSLVDNPTDNLTKILRNKMFPRRQPPLKATKEDNTKSFFFKIYYLLPGVCEADSGLKKANYINNCSIMARLNYKGNVVLFCGDMMKDGMSKIINSNATFNADLMKYGVDFLITPHHGLRSSFSADLFSTIKGNKTRGLNVIPEKPTKEGSNEIVDTRYGSSDYCKGHIVLNKGKRYKKNMLKTSTFGHIRIELLENKQTRVVAGDSALNMY